MAVDRLDSRFFISFGNCRRDWLEETGTFCLYPLRAAFGYRVAEWNGKNSVAIEKVQRSVLAFFLFFLTLPLLLLPTVIGVIVLLLSPFHRKNYRELKEYFQEDPQQFSNYHEAYSFYDKVRHGEQAAQEGITFVLPDGMRKKFRLGNKRGVKITYSVEQSMKLEDLMQIQKIERQGFGRRNDTSIELLQQPAREFILARIEGFGKIVGVLHYYPSSKEPDTLYISSICRRVRYGGKGIAEELIRRFKERAQKKYKKAALHVRESNPALQLYERNGFTRKEEGDTQYPYDPPEKACYMECPLRHEVFAH